MKTLKDYIIESHGDMTTSKNIKFNFKSLSEADNKIKEMIDICSNDNIEFIQSDESITITVTRDQAEHNKLNNLTSFLDSYSTALRKDSKNASNESYAQTTKKFKNNVESLHEFIELSNEENDNVQKNKEEE